MKNVVVDFSNLDDMSGFGEIARNYAPRLAKAAKNISDMHFLFILPEKHRNSFGTHIDYLSREHLKKELHIETLFIYGILPINNSNTASTKKGLSSC